MIFRYEAINRKGSTVRDIIESQSMAKAKQKLKEQGLYVKTIAVHDKQSISASDTSVFARYAEKMSHRSSIAKTKKNISLFSRQLSTLLKAGMPLARAIGDILDQTDNPYFKLILADIKQKVESGTSLSSAMATHPDIFSEMYSNMIKIGESMGSIDIVVERLADVEEKRETLKSSVKLAMYYPGFMFSFTCVVIVIMMLFVVPTISEMFTQIGKELPLPTKIVIGASSFLTNYWFILLILIIIFAFMFSKYKKTPEGRLKIDELKFKIPVFKHFYSKIVVLRFCQSLGILLQNGVDIIKSLDIVKKSIENTVVEKKIEEAASNIREGAAISRALAAGEFLPKMVTGMISVGEASDTLSDMLIKIGVLYEQEVDRAMQSLTKLIEPALILVMGGLIGLIAMAVILPVVDINTSIQ